MLTGRSGAEILAPSADCVESENLMRKDDGIEMFQELRLRGRAGQRDALRAGVVAAITEPWSQVDASEHETIIGRDDDVIALERHGDGLPEAGLLLWSTDDGYEVMNIVPLSERELDYRAYNDVLGDLIERILRTPAETNGFRIELGSSKQSLEDWMPPATADALRVFSLAANKATGSSHPRDRSRWNAFLIQAHRAAPDLSTDNLERWLVEVGGWGPDKAVALVIEYEFARALLADAGL